MNVTNMWDIFNYHCIYVPQSQMILDARAQNVRTIYYSTCLISRKHQYHFIVRKIFAFAVKQKKTDFQSYWFIPFITFIAGKHKFKFVIT